MVSTAKGERKVSKETDTKKKHTAKNMIIYVQDVHLYGNGYRMVLVDTKTLPLHFTALVQDGIKTTEP